MQYLYNSDSGLDLLSISGEDYKYLFRVRRLKVGSFVQLRNLKDNKLYTYKVLTVNKKEAALELAFSEESQVLPKKELHIGWCIIDPKNIEKALPSLNEIVY